MHTRSRCLNVFMPFASRTTTKQKKKRDGEVGSNAGKGTVFDRYFVGEAIERVWFLSVDRRRIESCNGKKQITLKTKQNKRTRKN